ncbi:hypothetical protein LIER_36924 [Lithospermum erythrorhizon]|uniref:Integrase catalytic domain-containing protein n=1 Tax=Lithospermum erythrorhizon TaxID=34254 RepID=A0AAV3PFE2_LITER
MVISWLIHSVEKEIAERNKSISMYFSQLQKFWDEYSNSLELEENNVVVIQNFLQTQCIMQFLMELNEAYSTVRGNILMINHFPKLDTVLQILLQEEKQREMSNPVHVLSDATALYTNSGGFNARGKDLHQEVVDFIMRCKFAANVREKTFTEDQFAKLVHFLDKVSKDDNGASTSQALMAGIILNSQSPIVSQAWILDNGATDHITPFLSSFQSYKQLPHLAYIIIPNGCKVPIKHIGSVVIGHSIILHNALHIPDFHYNLISVQKLTSDLKAQIIFTDHSCILQGHSQKAPLFASFSCHNLLASSTSTNAPSVNSSIDNKCKDMSVEESLLWHCRLGHLPFDRIAHIHSIPVVNKKTSYVGQICPQGQGKQYRNTFTSSQSHPAFVFDLIHVDTWGPYKDAIYNGYKYCLTIVDDHTRITWTHLLVNKSNAFTVLKSFLAYVKTHFNAAVKVIRSDNAAEFAGIFAQTFYATQGILHQTSCVHTPQKNGVVERRNIKSFAHINIRTLFNPENSLISYHLIMYIKAS